MTSTARILKNLRSMGEAEFVKIVTDHARTVHPTLTKEQAFTKVFTAADSEGQAIRRCWLIAKGQDIASGPLDEPITDDDDADALDELNELAEQERRRNPGMSKAVAFTKVYTDPANAALAQRERRQNQPRAA